MKTLTKKVDAGKRIPSVITKGGAPVKKSSSPTGIRINAGSSKGKNTESALLDFFTDEIKDIYWAEKHLVKTLPKMSKAASSAQLSTAISGHLEQTKTHVLRLEQVFELLGKKAQAKKCDAMAGLAEEGAGIIEDTDSGTAIRDVGIILASQKVEHYEIATYGGLLELAKNLGLTKIATLLGKTLEEEKQADSKLSSIATNNINYDAAQE